MYNTKFVNFTDILGYRVVTKWNDLSEDGAWFSIQIWKRGASSFNRLIGFLQRPDGEWLKFLWADIK